MKRRRDVYKRQVSGSNSGSVGVKYNGTGYTNATKNAFQDTTTSPGKTMLTKAINALAAEGATRTDLGMDMACLLYTSLFYNQDFYSCKATHTGGPCFCMSHLCSGCRCLLLRLRLRLRMNLRCLSHNIFH